VTRIAGYDDTAIANDDVLMPSLTGRRSTMAQQHKSMTIEQAIEKAVEGGYQNRQFDGKEVPIELVHRADVFVDRTECK
jgi:hypothetical protein